MAGETSNVSLPLSVYLVVFIDLLGQSAELARVQKMPTTDDEKKAASIAFNKSAGPVRRLRNSFNELVSELMGGHAEVQALVAPEHLEAFMRVQPQVNHVGFSDTFEVSVSLQERGEPEGAARATSAVFNVLVGVAGVSLWALGQGIPLRGGVQA